MGIVAGHAHAESRTFAIMLGDWQNQTAVITDADIIENSIMKLTSRCILLLPVIALLGCCPVYMRGQGRIKNQSMMIRDAKTGEAIPEALILVRYSDFVGVSTFFGEGPGTGKMKYYLAYPFIHENNNEFAPVQRRSYGIMFGPGFAFIGKGKNLDYLFVFAPHYKLLCLSNLSDIRTNDTIKLEHLPCDKAQDTLIDIQKLISLKELRGNDVKCFELDPKSQGILEIRFSPDEREMIDRFMAKAQKLDQAHVAK